MCVSCTRFASLSVSSGSEAASGSPRMHHPLYGGGLASAMSHTYMNQYTGSEYNLDKVQVRKLHSLRLCSGSSHLLSVVIDLISVRYLNTFAVTMQT
jgi:hypothetical protein